MPTPTIVYRKHHAIGLSVLPSVRAVAWGTNGAMPPPPPNTSAPAGFGAAV